jgi:hypothetical protein
MYHAQPGRLQSSVAIRGAGEGRAPGLFEGEIWRLKTTGRFCTRCYTLFWYGYAANGVCSAGGAHSPLQAASPTGAGTSWDFALDIASTSGPAPSPGGGGGASPAGTPGNWRFCTKCYGLFWYGYPTAGTCPDGGAHSPFQAASLTGAGTSWDFALPIASTTSASRYLHLSEQHQQQTEWCWSATTVSITSFHDPGSTWTQCSLVNQAFGQSTCCQDGSSSACNQPWYPDKALTIVGHLASSAGGKPSFQTIEDTICAGNPVSIAIYWNGGGGHNPAVDGYDDKNQPTIDIQDPWYGPSTQDFDTFPASYNGGASWGDSYFTK